MTTLTTGSAAPRSLAWIYALSAVLFAATLLNYANRFAFTQNAEQVKQSLGISDEGYGRIEGNFGLGFAFGGILFGVLADYISVRLLYPAVLIAWSLAGMTSASVSTLEGMIACRFLLGLFEAGHWPCALRTTQRSFLPDQRTWGNSLLQSGASMGAMLTPMLVLLIYQWQPDSWKLTFYLVGGVGAVWAVAWLLLVRESDMTRPVIRTDEQSKGRGEAKEIVELPFFQLFLTRRWWLLFIVVIAINTVWHYVRVWMVVTLESERHYSHDEVQYISSAYYLATMIGGLAAGYFTALLPRLGWNVHRARLTVFFLCSLLTACAVPAAFVPSGPLFLALLMVVGFASLGLFPIYYSFNQELSAKNQGKVGGSLAFSAWGVLYFIHPAVGWVVVHHPEARPYMFAVVGLGPLVGWLVLAIGWRWGERNQPSLTFPPPAAPDESSS